MLTFTVIIVTLNRPNVLHQTLESILLNSIVPKHTIIVDQSDNKKTKNLIEFVFVPKFKKANREIIYFHVKKKSLTHARNIGISKTKEDILFFFDDDVILSNDYIENVLMVFEKNPSLNLAQGMITNNTEINCISNIIRKLFFLDYNSTESKVLQSFQATSIANRNLLKKEKIVKLEWTSGCCMACRRSICNEFLFDEHLIKYSLGEDRDFSYRIYKQYPESVAMVINAKMIHKRVSESRLSNRNLLFMASAHSIYLFNKNIKQNILTKFIFFWSWFGRLCFGILNLATLRKKNILIGNNILRSIAFAIKNYKEFKKGNLNALYKILEK